VNKFLLWLDAHEVILSQASVHLQLACVDYMKQQEVLDGIGTFFFKRVEVIPVLVFACSWSTGLFELS